MEDVVCYGSAQVRWDIVEYELELAPLVGLWILWTQEAARFDREVRYPVVISSTLDERTRLVFDRTVGHPSHQVKTLI